MAIESAADLIMALLYSPGKSNQPGEEVRGITRLEKLVFLLLKEAKFEMQLGKELSFEAYDFGPYSGTVVDVLDALQGEDLVRTAKIESASLKEVADGLIAAQTAGEMEGAPPKTVLLYGLTERGERVGHVVFQSLSREEREAITRLKARYNSMNLSDLLEYVYRQYPRMIHKSRILDRVLGFGARPTLPSQKED